jgi:5-methylcytosine-specific restriction endonuclease McrA
MSDAVPGGLRRLVSRRAAGRCEYCLLHEEDSFYAHQPDHVIALKHGGLTIKNNLAWACHRCNRRKGTDIASVDPTTKRIVRLFNPRRDKWSDHFRVERGRIIPLTPVGEVTVFLLKLNSTSYVEMRKILIREGRYPR